MATTAKTTTTTRTSKTGEIQKVLDLVRDRKLQVVDVKFCDLPGIHDADTVISNDCPTKPL